MRQTLFLVPFDYLAIFVRGTARRAEKEIRWARGKGAPNRVVDLLHLAAARGVICYGPNHGNEPSSNTH